jgi:Leucine-rich repeat (LRR) protein
MFKILPKHLLISIVVFFPLCGLTAWHVHAAIPAAERAALIALYNGTDGDNWNDNTGWKEPPLDVDGFALPGTENTWFGVTTDGGNANVTQINLGNNQLIGSIPPELGNLSNLQALSLNRNQLSGDIPAELENPANLQSIILEFNQLTGTIPIQLGNLANLINLDLQGNQLSGNIPAELRDLISLESLDLRQNQLTGNIPIEIGDLANLEGLVLTFNQLTGDIPAELGNLANLLGLRLDNNQLTGGIPSELENLANLEWLDLSSNQLTGTIPSELSNLINLDIFFINSNVLIGTIPLSLINLIGLSNTDIGYNALNTDNATLGTFLSGEDPDWEDTQTVPPEDVSASTASDTSVEVSWTPILYTADSGGYQVFYGTSSGGPYTLLGSTIDKSASHMEVTGLDPGTTYFFVVKTRTDPHMQNQNTVDSKNSQEATATTTGDSGKSSGCFIATAAYGSPMAEEIKVLRKISKTLLQILSPSG